MFYTFYTFYISGVRFLFLFIFVCWFVGLKAQQNKVKHWHYGLNNCLVFDDTLNYSSSNINLDESSSSISDTKGKLLFYTNGNNIYNKHNNIIKNGQDVGFKISNNTTTSMNGSILVSHPDNSDSIVYLFNTDYQGRGGGLVYSKILTYGNNDSGEVILKKQKIISPINESITAVNHSNGKDIWIVCHSFGNDFFYAFLLTKNGISECSVKSKIGLPHCNSGSSCAQVAIKFSPDGKKIAVQSFAFNTTQIFEFDATSGTIYKIIYNYNGQISYTFEFSNNSDIAYLNKSKQGIEKINLLTQQTIDINYYLKSITGIQIAKDGNIYMCEYPTKDIYVITNSEDIDDTIKYKKLVNVTLNSNTTFPTFNQSYFYNPAINYSYEMNCTKNSIQFWGKDTFGASSHVWQVRKLAIGNWQLAGSTKNINYTFSDTGTYEVRYIASNGNKVDTVVKSIVLYDKIKQDFLGKDTAYAQGDLINKTLFASTPNHCVRWYDLTPSPSPKERGTGSSLLIDSVGTYICKVTNQAFCEVWDTVVISECINNLNQPSLYRSRDTLRTFHLNADSFVWYRNNQIYKVTKQPFLALTDTGNYRVEAAKKGHCNRGSVGQLLVNMLSVKGIRIEDLGIRVFPNPSNGIISIQSQNPFKLKVNAILGQTIYEGENINNIHLQKGVYFLHFEVKGNRYVEKVVVW